MKFSEEMKMMLQIRQLSLQNQKINNLRAAQADYTKLVQKLTADLKAQIRRDVTEGTLSLKIEGDMDLPLCPSVQCGTVPQLDEPSALFSYQTRDSLSYFCWAAVCRGIYDGKRMASKNVCIELTEAGRRLLSDLSATAQEEGIGLTFQPALLTRTGKVILPQFGQFENVPHPKHGKKGVLNDYFVNMHYEII